MGDCHHQIVHQKRVAMKIDTMFRTVLMVWVVSAFVACQQQTSAPEASASTAPTKGQSAVVDPDSKPHILQIALNSPDHTTLVKAVQAAGLEDVLTNAGPLTVFAPTNDAFAQLPEGTLDELLKPENKQTLARIIKFHAAPGKFTEDMLKDGMNLFMASGHYVKVEKKADGTYVHGAKIIGTVEASNGLIHVVDKVMLPPELQ